MTRGQYVAAMLGTNFMSAAIQHTATDQHLVAWVLIVTIALNIWFTSMRVTNAGKSQWWVLLIFIPFCWIAIACFKPKDETNAAIS